ncbi:MAG TPA: Clp protease N-terminal domain-containing protein [Actinophytocola sp.]|uniref:Clp protease N-terminal domain-containing protein n=1 Tax=Actinophytocola sp. TaxID=1872138 RepID=UPI002DBD03DE|nr:Clp protease N-terminal domain-containing protein [Actinophytocola sp.]HEU5474010.1 Clp protease N-terminal domain-containing protein [Actinophytocola sp.]
MFERFSAKAREVVVKAQEESRSLQHDYIGTEHVLLGVLAIPDTTGCQALRQLGLTRELVRADIETEIGRGKKPSQGHIPFTPRAKKVLELALREALQLKHNYIGTEHIVLALVREGEGLAAKIMSVHIPDLAQVRRMVLALITGDAPVEPVPRRPGTTAAEEIVSAAQALAGGAPVGSHHLLEALVRAEGSMAARVFEALGVDPETVAAKIDEIDPEGTTDATPEEAAARRMELRVVDDEVQLVFRDEHTLDLATKVTELSGGAIQGTGPVSGAFVPLLKSTSDLLLSFLRILQPEPEGEAGDVGGKTSLMMRRVMRDRLLHRLRRNPPAEGTG